MPSGHSEPGRGAVRFGVFELDLRTGELRKSGRLLHVPEQPFQILRELVLAPKELVERGHLQEILWPGETIPDLDHRLNAAVNSLRNVLGDSARSPRYIETLPRRGYRFLPSVERMTRDASVDKKQTPSRFPWGKVAASAVGITVIAAIIISIWPSPAPPAPPEFKEVRLTLEPGVERFANLSPDGNWVAYEGGNDYYATGGSIRGETDIYLTRAEAGGGPPIRVTSAPGVDTQPAWSPDGSEIVFVRILESLRGTAGTRFKLMVAPPLEDAPVRELAARTFLGRHWGVGPTWSPDGDYLAFACRYEESRTSPSQICMLSIESGETWPLTFPPDGPGDWHPVFSPDGREIAFFSNRPGNQNWIFVQTLTADMRAEGDPRPLTPGAWRPAWSRDGKLLYFVKRRVDGGGIWAIDGSAGGEPALVRRVDGQYLSLWENAEGKLRITYEAETIQSEIVVMDLRDPSGESTKSPPFVDAYDRNPEFSPDGSRIAFKSDRSGSDGIWLWNYLDGSRPELLAELGNSSVDPGPAWSPDGKRIADNASAGPERGARIIEVATGRVSPPLEARVPTWSGDSKSLYSSTNTDPRRIWKLNLETGAKQLLAEGEALGRPWESSSGEYLYFRHDSDLLRVGLGPMGLIGEPTKIASDVVNKAVVAGGIYFTTRSGEVMKIDEETGETNPIRAALPPLGCSGLSVSPDERWLACTRRLSSASDLWMLESVE